MIPVKELYNQLAVITGFPIYSTENDTPDTTRFLLDNLARALDSIIDVLYTSNNILERRDKIVTTADKNIYGIGGIVKTITVSSGDNKRFHQLEYDNNFNPNLPFEYDKENMGTGEPNRYCISGGYLRLFPVPDKEYTLDLTLSTTRLIWSDNDASKPLITSIDDYVLVDDEVAVILVLRAAALVFARCRNSNSQIYQDLCTRRLQTIIERDYGSIQADRFLPRSGGNYNARRGLLG